MTARSILLLEDEALIGLDLQMTLEENGYSVIGPFLTSDAAEEALGQDRPSLALLDVNLGRGETSLPLARRLRELNVPVVFLTGYSAETGGFPDDLRDVRRLSKPIQDVELLSALQGVL
ncbi:response regulator [Marivita sp. GX14005]|uniref:response regulator n=1 Tax=Marivita sp. GX14005 TaxID=2942276 RepID=UPI002018C44C|nr:response regulator [Marivita sp. GX14005]MCL3882882.1 response regulator [Marivita sp. GX14005]